MTSRVTIQIRVSDEDKELFLFKSRNSGFDSLSSWFKWLGRNAPIIEVDRDDSSNNWRRGPVK